MHYQFQLNTDNRNSMEAKLLTAKGGPQKKDCRLAGVCRRAEACINFYLEEKGFRRLSLP